MRVAAITLFVVMFFTCQLVLSYFFPLHKDDLEEWQRYFMAKDAAYDLMFVLSSWLVFSLAEKPLLKAIAAFALIMTAGSFVDKVIFQLNQYLWSDVLLTVLGIIASWRVYKHGRHKRLGS
jgi:uncharacterized membrane protein